MKNLIFLLVLVIVSALTIQGQNKATYDVTLEQDDFLYQYRAKAADTVSANKTTFSFAFFNAGQGKHKENFTNRWEIALDSISGTPSAVSIAYQRRNNIFTTWVTDSTQTFSGSTSDTTLVYYDTSAKPDPYRRVLVTYAGTFVIKIDWLSGLFLIE